MSQNNNRNNRKPKIVVLASSTHWCSLIKESFTHADLDWVLDADALIEAASKQTAQAAIVEIPTAKADKICVQLAELTNNSQDLKLFAVGDDGLHEWGQLLRAAGFVFSCWSILQTPLLVEAVTRHLHSATVRQETLESAFESDLPWPTAANDAST